MRPGKGAHMKATAYEKQFLVEEDRPFDSGHASTLVRLENGDILAAWFAGSWEKGPDTSIWMARRSSTGTWGAPYRIAETRNIAMWNPILFVRDDKTIMLFYKVGVLISEWKTFLKESTDNGHSFSKERELVPGDGQGGRGPVKNKPITLHDGTILAPASFEGEYWDVFVDRSTDGGRTWDMGGIVPIRHVGFNPQIIDRPFDPTYCFGKGAIQPTLWEDDDHVVHMLARTTSSRIFASESYDGGTSWTLAHATSLPNNNSGIDLVRLPDGTLVLAYNPTENYPNYYKGPRTPLSLAYSKDNGATWKDLITLEDEPGAYAYPAIICNGNDELLLTYTWKRERIVFWRVSLGK